MSYTRGEYAGNFVKFNKGSSETTCVAPTFVGWRYSPTILEIK